MNIGMQINLPHPLLFSSQWHLRSASPTPQAPRPICAKVFPTESQTYTSAFILQEKTLINTGTLRPTPLWPELLK